jgi:hypothetical protein
MSKIKYQGPFFVDYVERLKLSVNGNPRFRVILKDRRGNREVYISKSDASVNYEIENATRSRNAGRAYMFAFTRAGRIEYMRPANPADIASALR